MKLRSSFLDRVRLYQSARLDACDFRREADVVRHSRLVAVAATCALCGVCWLLYSWYTPPPARREFALVAQSACAWPTAPAPLAPSDLFDTRAFEAFSRDHLASRPNSPCVCSRDVCWSRNAVMTRGMNSVCGNPEVTARSGRHETVDVQLPGEARTRVSYADQATVRCTFPAPREHALRGREAICAQHCIASMAATQK